MSVIPIVGPQAAVFGGVHSEAQNIASALIHALTGAHTTDVDRFLTSDEFNCRGIKERTGQEAPLSTIVQALERHLESPTAQAQARNFLGEIGYLNLGDGVYPWHPGQHSGDVYERAMTYHEAFGGKTVMLPVVPMNAALAYTPGVGRVCETAHNNIEDVYFHTGRGRTGLIVSDDTGVLGYGKMRTGSVLSVLQGKGMISQMYAGVQLLPFLLPYITPDNIDMVCEMVACQSPQGGLVMVEDVGAPICFDFVRRLERRLDIPAMQDDSIGTAIVTFGALINAVEYQGFDWKNIRVVINGCGAAGIAIADMLIESGLELGEQLQVLDSKGLVYKGRAGVEEGSDKARVAVNSSLNVKPSRYGNTQLDHLMNGLDVFIGVSVADVVSVEMLQTMNPRGIAFSMANPKPEIPSPIARRAMPGMIIASGRSDDDIQINNASGYPYLNRAILRAGARRVTRSMRHALSRQLASVARAGIPEHLRALYPSTTPLYGGGLVFPRIDDPRLLEQLPIAVAQAAVADPSAETRRRVIDVEAEIRSVKAHFNFMREYSGIVDRRTSSYFTQT